MSDPMADPKRDNPAGVTDPLGGAIGGGAAPSKKPDEQPVEREWMKDLPEPLKGSKSLTKFADKAALAKAYTELEGKLGRSIELPPSDASPEDRAKFFERLGRPKAPEEYAIAKGKADDTLVAMFRKKAYEKGLTADQAKELFDVFNADAETREATALAQYTERIKLADYELRKEHGAAYDQVVASAKRAFGALYSESLQAQLRKDGYSANPDFINSLARIGRQLSDDSLLRGVNGVEAKPLDPLQAAMAKKFGQA